MLYDIDEIINMDETPIYMDPSIPRTIDFVGNPTVSVVNTGGTKLRTTLALTISDRGCFLPHYVLFKGTSHIISDNSQIIFLYLF